MKYRLLVILPLSFLLHIVMTNYRYYFRPVLLLLVNILVLFLRLMVLPFPVKIFHSFVINFKNDFIVNLEKKPLNILLLESMGTTATVPIIDHLIIVGLPCSERDMVYNAWSKGRVDIEPVGNGAIRYCLEYIDKQVFGADSLYEYYGDFEPPFAHFSKGIGKDWIEKNLDKFNKYGRINFADSGKSYSLNPYYRRKYGFELKPYVTPYSDSVIKYAVENKMSLPEALEKRSKLKELCLVHKQIKKREPITNCSKYIIQKEIQKYKNKGLYDNPDVQAQFTKALLKADDYLISNPETTNFPMASQTEYQLKYIKNKNALIQLSLNNS